MRLPFYMDRLSPDDRRTVKLWQGCVIVAYSAIILLVFATVSLRSELDQSRADATRCDDVGPYSRTHLLVGASPTSAMEPRAVAPRTGRVDEIKARNSTRDGRCD